MATRTPRRNRSAEFVAGEVRQKDIMKIQSQKEFKTLVSGVRRELKTLFPGSPQASHTQMMEVLAKAFGMKSLAELQARLPAESPQEKVAAVEEAPAEVYPLRNRFGDFDIVVEGKRGKLVHGLTGEGVEGVLEDIKDCVASAHGGKRLPCGTVQVTYLGETDVNWDGQVPQEADDGSVQWILNGGGTVLEHECILVPYTEDDEFDFDNEDNLDLPNREALLDEYLKLATPEILKRLAKELPEDGLKSAALVELAEAIGFSLHRGELVSLERMVSVRA